MLSQPDLASICRRLRYDILTSTTAAGSGHPTSSLSAVELMATLFFGGFLRQNSADPHNVYNDRVIFSKGHASPLLYSLYEAEGTVSQAELVTLRTFSSRLQGHPTPVFPFADAATGSLGQGLSVGAGMAIGIRLALKQKQAAMKREPTVWVLLGDSESAEGQVWEAMELASKYSLNNLVGILDVNRLGQGNETELGWDINTYVKRAESFGWEAIPVKNGHNLEEVRRAFEKADMLNTVKRQKPVMIIARTVKGKGVSFLEDKEGWHGKPVPHEMLSKALKELGKVDLKQAWTITKPEIPDDKLNTVLTRLELLQFAIGGGGGRDPDSAQARRSYRRPSTDGRETSGRIYGKSENVSTREAFGHALLELGRQNDKIVVLDAEVGNSTYTDFFAKEFPDRFFQIYIDEENMASVALGLAKLGFIPYFATFAAFLTRAFDQIRMMQYSFVIGGANGGCPTARRLAGVTGGRALAGGNEGQNLSQMSINIIGSHAGVSIGQDGPSQMGLEDIAMMRSIRESTVLYPADGVCAAKLTFQMTKLPGIKYLRTTRGKTPVIYENKEEFPVPGFKIHPAKKKSEAVVIAAGITLHEALKAQKQLEKKNIFITVVDLYAVKPFDVNGLRQLIKGIKQIIVAEDHYEYGGIGEAVKSTLAGISIPVTHLCVRKQPCSGTPEELLSFEEIDAAAIISALRSGGSG